jgi:hypothetical protein
MVFVYLPDGGFRLDLLTWWGPADKEALEEHPNEPVAYDLLVGDVEHRCGTTATLEQFTEAVRSAQGTSLVFHRPFLDMKA